MRSILFVSYPYFLEYGEGNLRAHGAACFDRGNLYKPLTTLPLIVANYPPVYFLLNWFWFYIQCFFSRAMYIHACNAWYWHSDFFDCPPKHT